MSEREYDLLIFDWDGTLSDSASLIVGTMQAAIRALELPPRHDEQISELIGLGLHEGLQILFPEHDPDSLQALLHGYRQQWLANVAVSEAPLFDGAHEAMAQLDDAGYCLAIATGKSRAGLDRSLRALPSLAALIAHSRCADETVSKPDPRMLQELLQVSGCDPERALMIGDTEYDMRMAAAIGMDAVGVACGVHSTERLMACGVREVLPTVAELSRWLKRPG